MSCESIAVIAILLFPTVAFIALDIIRGEK